MQRHRMRDVLLVSLLFCSPLILSAMLTVSVPGTLVALGAGGAALLRQVPTERWVGGRRAR